MYLDRVQEKGVHQHLMRMHMAPCCTSLHARNIFLIGHDRPFIFRLNNNNNNHKIDKKRMLKYALYRIKLEIWINYHLALESHDLSPGEGGNPAYRPYRYVRRQRVCFFSRFGLK